MKNLLTLGRVLNRTELNSIKGGDVTVTCSYPDGLGWELNFEGESGGNGNALIATENCHRGGGTATVEHHADD